MLGRRRSASISNTRTPFCARTTAQLMLVVVFPSCGSALVTMITLGGAPRLESNNEVRRARYDSAICDCGLTCVINSTASLEVAITRRLEFAPSREALEPRGIMPRGGRPEII